MIKYLQAASEMGASIYVGDEPPLAPSLGDLWYKSDTGTAYIYYDLFWVEVLGGSADVATKLTTSETPPASPEPSEYWYDTTTGKIYIYYDNFWVEM